LPHALPPGEEVQDCFQLDLDPLPRLVAEARRFVSEHAPVLPEDTLDALLLLTSELVTNAVLHARTRLEVSIAVTEHCVVVAVHDLDLARPQQQPYEPREGGWGLGLVAALAEASALESHPEGGKTAWFRVPRGPSVPVRDDAVVRTRRSAADEGWRTS
jgi:two-component sensor histidine kinase